MKVLDVFSVKRRRFIHPPKHLALLFKQLIFLTYQSDALSFQQTGSRYAEDALGGRQEGFWRREDGYARAGRGHQLEAVG